MDPLQANKILQRLCGIQNQEKRLQRAVRKGVRFPTILACGATLLP